MINILSIFPVTSSASSQVSNTEILGAKDDAPCDYVTLPDGKKIAIPCPDDNTVTPVVVDEPAVTPITTNPITTNPVTTPDDDCGFVTLPDGMKIKIPCPEEPVEPVAPVTPVEPVAPVTPVEPVAPVTPVEPVAPVTPTKKGLYEDLAEVNGEVFEAESLGVSSGTTYGYVDKVSFTSANDEMTVGKFAAAAAEMGAGDDTVYVDQFSGNNSCIHGGEGFDTVIIGKDVPLSGVSDYDPDVHISTFVEVEQIILDSDVTMDLDFLGVLYNHDDNNNLFIRGTENNVLDIGAGNENNQGFSTSYPWNKDKNGDWFEAGSKEVDGVCYDLYKYENDTSYTVYVENTIQVI